MLLCIGVTMSRIRWVLLVVAVVLVGLGIYLGVREYLAAQAVEIIHN